MTQWEAYVNQHRDLYDYYFENIAPSGQSMHEFGQSHYTTHGSQENRPLPQPPAGQVWDAQPTQNGTNLGGVGVDNPPATGGNNGGGGSPPVDVGGTVTTPTTPDVPTATTTNPGGGGNYSQNQNSNQQGAFATNNLTNQNQSVTGGENTSQAGTTNNAFTQTNQGTSSNTQNTSNVQNTSNTGTNFSNTGQTTAGRNQTSTTGETTGLNNTQSNNVSETNNTGQYNQTGAQQGTTTNNTNVTTGVVDTLGFGSALQGAMQGAQTQDANRTEFLTDFMQNGGTGFQGQIDQAVRQSLSGPQMSGAGSSSRARMASYGVEQVARNNANQRLNAAQQLAGPSAVTTVAQAGNPYLGTTQSGVSQGASSQVNNTSGNTANQSATAGSSNVANQTQQSTGSFTDAINNATTNTNQTGGSTNVGQTTNTGVNTSTGTTANTASGSSQGNSTNTSASTNWQDLLNSVSEQTAGTANASSAVRAAGNVPEGQPVKTGGCVICTAGIELGQWNLKRVLRYVVKHKLQKDWKRFEKAAKGYFFLFSPLAEWLTKHPRVYNSIKFLPRWVVYEELRVAGKNLPKKAGPWLAHWLWHWGCHAVGHLPVPERVTNRAILDIAQREGVLFEIKEAK